ncbi:hypothetical protein [Paraburkholderia sp. BL6669N2]|uniref:hypothetical protein n=1 Tax=Paraburkholderia sp. BL6669N2 TaxID=1938807 RepID=UPI0011C07952|nr:hypothetical protein [Paraburkholderia sp. BL6669N2]
MKSVTSFERSARDRSARLFSSNRRLVSVTQVFDNMVIEVALPALTTNNTMSIKEPNQQAATKTHNEVAKTIVDFMSDCGLGDADVNAGHLFFAFEFAYRPLPRFWRDFDMPALVEAISERFPNWRSAVQEPDWSADDVLREVEEFLHSNAFDEANAQMMMGLPTHARPTEWQEAADWICGELRKRKLGAELRFADRLGKRCGEGALQELRCLECIANGVAFERIGTSVARTWRNRVLAERQKGGCKA